MFSPFRRLIVKRVNINIIIYRLRPPEEGAEHDDEDGKMPNISWEKCLPPSAPKSTRKITLLHFYFRSLFGREKAIFMCFRLGIFRNVLEI
jgi:hypothetical protein